MTFRFLLPSLLLLFFILPSAAKGQAPVRPAGNDSLIAQLYAREQVLRERPEQVFQRKRHGRKMIVKSKVHEPRYNNRQLYMQEKTRYFKSGAVFREVVVKNPASAVPLLYYRMLNGNIIEAFFLDDQNKRRNIVNNESFSRDRYAFLPPRH